MTSRAHHRRAAGTNLAVFASTINRLIAEGRFVIVLEIGTDKSKAAAHASDIDGRDSLVLVASISKRDAVA